MMNPTALSPRQNTLAFYALKSRDKQFNDEMNRVFRKYAPKQFIQFGEIKNIAQLPPPSSRKTLLLVSHVNADDAVAELLALKGVQHNLFAMLFKPTSEYETGNNTNPTKNNIFSGAFDKVIRKGEEIDEQIDRVYKMSSLEKIISQNSVQQPLSFSQERQQITYNNNNIVVDSKQTDTKNTYYNTGSPTNNPSLTQSRHRVHFPGSPRVASPNGTGTPRSNSSGNYRIRLESVKKVQQRPSALYNNSGIEPRILVVNDQNPYYKELISSLQIPCTFVDSVPSISTRDPKTIIIAPYSQRRRLISTIDPQRNSNVKFVLYGDELPPDNIVLSKNVDLTTQSAETVKSYLISQGIKLSSYGMTNSKLNGGSVSPIIKNPTSKSLREIKAVSFEPQQSSQKSQKEPNEEYFGKQTVAGVSQSRIGSVSRLGGVASTSTIFQALNNNENQYTYEWNVKKNIGKKIYSTYLVMEEDRFMRGSFANSRRDANSQLRERSFAREPSIKLLPDENKKSDIRSGQNMQQPIARNRQSTYKATQGQDRSKLQQSEKSSGLINEWQVIMNPNTRKFVTISRDFFLSGRYSDQNDEMMRLTSNKSILKSVGTSQRELKEVPKRKIVELGAGGANTGNTQVSSLTVQSVDQNSTTRPQPKISTTNKPQQPGSQISQDANEYIKSVVSQPQSSKGGVIVDQQVSPKNIIPNVNPKITNPFSAAPQNQNPPVINNTAGIASTGRIEGQLNTTQISGGSSGNAINVSNFSFRRDTPDFQHPKTPKQVIPNSYAKQWVVNKAPGKNLFNTTDLAADGRISIQNEVKLTNLEKNKTEQQGIPKKNNFGSELPAPFPIHYTESFPILDNSSSIARLPNMNKDKTSFSEKSVKQIQIVEYTLRGASKKKIEDKKVVQPSQPKVQTSTLRDSSIEAQKVMQLNKMTSKYDAEWEVRRQPGTDEFGMKLVSCKIIHQNKPHDLDTIIQNTLKVKQETPKPSLPHSNKTIEFTSAKQLHLPQPERIIQTKPPKQPLVDITKQTEYKVLVASSKIIGQLEEKSDKNAKNLNNHNISTDDTSRKVVVVTAANKETKKLVVEPDYRITLGSHEYQFPEISPIQRDMNNLSIDTVEIAIPPLPLASVHQQNIQIDAINKQPADRLTNQQKNSPQPQETHTTPLPQSNTDANNKYVYEYKAPVTHPAYNTKVQQKTTPVKIQTTTIGRTQSSPGKYEVKTYHVTPTPMRENYHLLQNPPKVQYRTLSPLTDLSQLEMRIENGVRVYSRKKRDTDSPAHIQTNVIQHTQRNVPVVSPHARIVQVSSRPLQTYIQPSRHDIYELSRAQVINGNSPGPQTNYVYKQVAIPTKANVQSGNKDIHLSEINNIIADRNRPHVVNSSIFAPPHGPQRGVDVSPHVVEPRQQTSIVNHDRIEPKNQAANMHLLLGSIQSIGAPRVESLTFIDNVQVRQANNLLEVNNNRASIQLRQENHHRTNNYSGSLQYQLVESEPVSILYLIPITRSSLFEEVSKFSTPRDRMQSYRSEQQLVGLAYELYNLVYIFPIDQSSNRINSFVQSTPDNTHVVRLKKSQPTRKDIHLNGIWELPEMTKELCRKKPILAARAAQEQPKPNNRSRVQVILKKMNQLLEKVALSLNPNQYQIRTYYTAAELNQCRREVGTHDVVLLVSDEVPGSIDTFLALPRFECIIIPGGKFFKAQQARYPNFEWLLEQDPTILGSRIRSIAQRVRHL